MTPDIAKEIYLIFSARLTRRAVEEELNNSLIQAQLNEAKHQLYLAISKSQRGLHHGF
ncbi:hypothetical protein [Legionella sp. 29fVS95]|uniref:hypothetical protein n=1 Tax=Legionella sp. 29fVS95 TaxID=3402813 RepID=UPI003AF77D0D